jgi:hypothetical protein
VGRGVKERRRGDGAMQKAAAERGGHVPREVPGGRHTRPRTLAKNAPPDPTSASAAPSLASSPLIRSTSWRQNSSADMLYANRRA